MKNEKCPFCIEYAHTPDMQCMCTCHIQSEHMTEIEEDKARDKARKQVEQELKVIINNYYKTLNTIFNGELEPISEFLASSTAHDIEESLIN